MILLVDNYDSFSYNLYQLAGSINPDMKVIRNDEMTIDEICALAPASIISSPTSANQKYTNINPKIANIPIQKIFL